MGINISPYYARIASAKWIFALALWIIIPGCKSTAQITAPVETVDGRPFYMHTVKKGETAFGISRQYGCDINVLLAANPGSDAGIREGQVIRIPVDKATVSVQQANKSEEDVRIHEVRRRETLFSIARDYNVDVNELAAANPGADRGVKPGQMLKIPDKKEAPAIIPKETTQPATAGQVHIVQPGETLYGIARQYSITVEAIQSANPGMTESLKPGQELRIPVRAHPLEPGPNDHSPLDVNRPFSSVPVDGEIVKSSYSFGLLLPFLAQPGDTIGLSAREKRLQSAALQMYRGAMIGFDSIAQLGLSADVYTYDVGDDKPRARTVLSVSEMQTMDVLIGPAFRDPLAEVATASGKRGIHVVCPVPQANKILLSSRNMSKAHPSEITVWEGMGKFIAKEHGRDNVILLVTNDVEDLKRIHAFRTAYRRQRGDSVPEFALKNKSVSGLSKRLQSSGTNVVVVPSVDRMLLTTLFNELNSSNTIVYGTEEWEDLSIIDVQARNKYHVRFPKSVFIDYTDDRIIDWLEGFRKRFRSEPDEYAFLGYSLVLYYGKGLLKFGRDFPNHFGEWSCPECLAVQFQYARTGEDSGFENRAFFVVGTEDYQLTRISH